jgi:hypothetical protein
LAAPRHVFPPNALALIWINPRTAEFANEGVMKPRPRPLIRHCPVCGIAMQASKSLEHLADFDTFQCLTCHTTIREKPAQPRSAATKQH